MGDAGEPEKCRCLHPCSPGGVQELLAELRTGDSEQQGATCAGEEEGYPQTSSFKNKPTKIHPTALRSWAQFLLRLDCPPPFPWGSRLLLSRWEQTEGKVAKVDEGVDGWRLRTGKCPTRAFASARLQPYVGFGALGDACPTLRHAGSAATSPRTRRRHLTILRISKLYINYPVSHWEFCKTPLGWIMRQELMDPACR